MISRDYVILAADGMHARPATALIRLTKKFRCSFNLRKGDTIVKMNSMLNILALQAKGGETISIYIDGEDESAAAAELDLFFDEQAKNL